MKIFSKTVVWIIAAVSVVLFFFGFFGAKTHYGDVATIVVNGVEQLNTGVGLGKTVSVKLSASEDTILTDQQLAESKRVVEQRLSAFNIADYEVYCDYDGRSIVVDLPYTASINSVLSLVGSKGEFVVRKGMEETDSSVVFNLSNINSATLTGNGNEMMSIFSIDIAVDSAAKAALKETTQAMADEYAASESEQLLSVWYNGQFIAKKAITDPIKDGMLKLDAVFGLDNNTASEMSILLNSDDIPFALTAKNIVESDLALSHSIKAIMIASATAAAAIAIYLLVRYRLSGLTAVFALLGTAGSLIAVQTGFMGTGAGGFTFASLAAFTGIMMLAVDCVMRDCVQIKATMNGNAVQRSVSDAMKSNLGLTLRSYFAVIMLGVILALFSKGGLFYSIFASKLISMGISTVIFTTVGYAGAVLIWGGVLSLIFCVLGNRLMLYSVCNYDILRKSVLFGGSANEKA
ncbi:MAG: hypothetical protein RSD08_01830 [Oscillospiraceae bacterium]